MNNISTYSDLHKDAYGFRPNDGKILAFRRLTVVQQEAELNDLEILIKDAIEFEDECNRVALNNFEDAVTTTINSGAGDRETALRWMFSEEHDIDHALYNLHLSMQDSDRLLSEILEALKR